MDFSIVISKLRDYFVDIGEPVKADVCNMMLTQLDRENSSVISLTEDEAKDLLRYFEKEAGYISYETSPGIHRLIKRINEKIYGARKFKPVTKKKSKKTEADSEAN